MATSSGSPRWFAVRDAWMRKSPRERILIGIAIAITATTLAWLLLVGPLLADSARAQRDLARDSALLAVARVQAEDIGKLGQVSPGRAPVEPRQAVERVLGEQGLRAAVTSLEVADGRVRLTFAAVRFDALLAMLDAVGQSDSLRPVEMTLTPRVEPGTVRAELALSR